MADKFKVKKGINVQPVVGSTVSEKGDLAYNSSTDKVELYNGAADPVVTEAKAATLTNKTLSGNTAATLISGSGTLTLNTTGTVTVPNATDTLVGKATTDTLTNKTLSGNTATNLVSGSGTLTLNTSGTATVPNATDTLVGKATTDTLTNKSISGSTNTITNVSLATGVTGTLPIGNGGTGQTGATAAFDALSPLTTKGDIVVHNGTNVVRQGVGTNGQVLVADSSQTNGVKFANAPQGLKNYITVNADLEQGATTGYSLGTATLTNAFPSGAPTFGSGASGNLSLTLVSSSQLAGTYSLGYVSSAATTAGNFVATDAFSVDLEGQAKVMQFKVAYSAVTNPSNGNFSGTSSNSFGVAIYDVTNSAWIQPAGVFNIVQNSGVGIASGTFQTTSNSTSYRLVFYNANASAGAITMYLDDFFVGPQITAAGAAVSDWTAYAPTLTGFSATPANAFKYRRVGDSVEIVGRITKGASTYNGLVSFTLPSGQSIDTTKTPFTSWAMLGQISAEVSSGNYHGILFQSGASTNTVVAYGDSGIGAWDGASSIPVATASLVGFDIHVVVPIVGWSSNTVMSSDTDTRVIAAYATGIPASVTSGNPIIYPTVTRDTSGAYNSTTGRYLVQVPGFYQISIGGAAAAGPAARLQIYNNAVAGPIIGFMNSTDGLYAGSGIVYANAGELLDVRPSQNMASFAATGSISINRLSGPATIAATDSVSMLYTGASGTLTTAFNTTTFGTKVKDTHSAYSSGTYTVPVSGSYSMSAQTDVSGTYSTGNVSMISVYIDGVESYRGIAVAATGFPVCVATVNVLSIPLLAGQLVTLRSYNDGTGPAFIASDSRNWFSIVRTGN